MDQNVVIVEMKKIQLVLRCDMVYCLLWITLQLFDFCLYVNNSSISLFHTFYLEGTERN